MEAVPCGTVRAVRHGIKRDDANGWRTTTADRVAFQSPGRKVRNDRLHARIANGAAAGPS